MNRERSLRPGKAATIFASWLLVGMALLTVADVAWADRKSSIPEYLSAWLTLEPPQHDSQAWKAAAWSDYEWKVEAKQGQPVAHRRDEKAEETAALPAILKHADGTQDERGEVSSTRVQNGWLIAYNAGEWGGSLWWYSPDGKQRYQISNHWIRQFLPTSHGLFALEGIAHLGFERGAIVQLQQDAAGRWTAKSFVKLEHAGEIGCVEDGGDLLVCTTESLVRVHPDKSMTTLVSDAFWRGLYPHSILRMPNGDIYLGMRHGVSRIYRTGGTYAVDWLLPNKEFVQAKPKF